MSMLSINGPVLRTCQGLSRRELLRAGGLSCLGLMLPDLLSGRTEAAEGKKDPAVPTLIPLPDYIAVNGPIRAGQHAGFLGSRFDPMVPRGNPNSSDFKPMDLGLVPSVLPERLRARQALLDMVGRQL